MLVTDVVDSGNVPITMLSVEMNISALLLDIKVSPNVVPIHGRGAQRKDKFTMIYLRVGTYGLKLSIATKIPSDYSALPSSIFINTPSFP